MSLRTRQTPQGTLVVQQTAPWYVRALGLPFLLYGGYFVWIFLTSIFEYVRLASLAEWIAAIPGMIIILFLAALFATPGAFVFFAGTKYEMSPSTRSIIEFDRFRPWRRKKEHALDDFDEIEVQMSSKRSGSGSTRTTNYFHEVRFRGNAKQSHPSLSVAVFGYEQEELERATAFARRLSSLLDFPTSVQDVPVERFSAVT